jgi:hypothetical protein
MNINEELDKIKDIESAYNNAMNSLSNALEQAILNLPDNENAQRISDSIQSVKFSSLKGLNNWSVATHDFKYQYRFIVDKLSSIKDIRYKMEFIKQIINDKHIKLSGPNNRLIFHPTVLELLKGFV